MAKYRIYALIIGQTLPESSIGECTISRMSYSEQEERGFAPIQSIFNDAEATREYTSYATSLPYVDPMRIRSEYVVFCELEEGDAKSALGGAIRRIDRLCQVLSLTHVEDAKNHTGRDRFPYEPYLYQVNQIYLIDDQGGESEARPELGSAHIYLPNRPEQNEWREVETAPFLDDLINFHDPTLKRALKYLYRSSIGHFINDSPEKITLDNCKAIELILKVVSNRDHLNDMLAIAKPILDLTDEEETAIRELWDTRSSTLDDVAHPSTFDQAERYPNQFPLPSNATARGASFDSIAATVCLKYFRYRSGLFNVDIHSPAAHEGSEGTLATVNATTEDNYYWFYTSESNKEQIKRKVKAALVRHLGISENDILEVTLRKGNRSLELRLK